MKRFALTLAAFALTGALAFADDMAPVAKLSGYVNAGPKIVSTSGGTTYQDYANDYGYGGSIARLTATLAGSNFGYVLAPIVKNGASAGFDTAYAWFSPFEGVKLVSGLGNDNPLGELDDNGKGYFSENGITAEYTNSGFTVGAVVSTSDTSKGSTSVSAPLTFGARYALDKVVTVNATAGTDGNSGLNSVYVTGSVTALPALTLTGGYNSTSIATTASTFIDFTVAYALTDAFKAGVVGYYYTTAGTYYIGSDSGVLKYKPNLSYTVAPGITVSAYLQGDTASNANYEPQGEIDWSPVAGATVKTQVFYDTNPGHAATATAATTFESDFILSF